MPSSEITFLQEVDQYMLSRRYAKRTIVTYRYWINQFFNYCAQRQLDTEKEPFPMMDP